MRHIIAIVTKLVIFTILLFIILDLFFGLTLGQVFTLAVIMTAITYPIGDLWLLRKWGNSMTVLTEFCIIVSFIWLIAGIFFVPYALLDTLVPLGYASIIAAILLSVAEAFYHPYVERHIFNE
ncbi:DUF2512 family protein [Salsuginibacillus kocurii]|uniref:DUF2512 family protein n=1 Tax=Salsuginibacillus kocurii TaxID=427078 RepID=UPI00037681B3|nr:DUF2512 family protein [Salsuginibacillus kocurii]